ncbi:hypothetical protein SAMN04488025_109111 [Planifilum fulgidum]|uniref:Tetratricopeptide repeat-containing protein n=1 Tax=Planifilum fulgidum TaxID=201973 RepID=A0A1I2MSZ2_9BACL|nr:hypothetical protein SAMN04488025_109111 [Planifilum fulgidum]
MIDSFLYEYLRGNKKLIRYMNEGKLSRSDFYPLAIAQLELLKQADPKNPSYVSCQAEFYHLDGHLRRAGELYRQVLEMEPPMELKEKEKRWIQKFCPLLLTTSKECFPLRDVVAIHHPTSPLIGYHLFWEDDYDFPDDCEPSDHEAIWIQYDPEREEVVKVMCWFHSRIIESEFAVKEAHNNRQRAIIRVEWGKHGSLLCGWESMRDPLTGIPLRKWLRKNYEQVKSGGRMPAHPLKKFWPAGFDGTFEEYTDFSVPVDPREWLREKPLMFKTQWANAALFTQALHYNFHPKMEWPNRAHRALRGS